MNKKDIINNIIDKEGGYVNDPNDSGGETNHGITIDVARANGYEEAMITMPREVAFSIYEQRYWNSVKADEMINLSKSVAEEVVDTAVNMGSSRAAYYLQRSLNVFNKQGSLYNDIVVDGKIGNATLTALTGYLSQRDEHTLVKALNCLQGAFYIELTERREKDERFVYGWLKNRVEI